jgi:ATP-binding cassette, subfamily B, bacterial PglK
MLRYFSKFLYVFPSNNLILIPWGLIFVLVSSLEIFGIGAIGPFIGLASNPELIHQNYWLDLIYTKLGLTQTSHFIAVVGFFVIAIFCLKSVISWYTQARIFKFSYIQKERLIARLMHGYIESDYTFYISKNSAQIIQNVIDMTNRFADGIMSTMLTSFSNSINIVAISILLCLVSPWAVASLLFTVIPLFFVFNRFKDKMRFWGQELYEANQGVIQSINHGLGGFKETRIIGCGEYFKQETIDQAIRFANASISFYAFKLLPRYIVEAILVIFLVAFTSILLLLGQNIQQLSATLSVFALASIRLIPAFTNLTNGLSVLRNSSFGLDRLYSDLKELEKTDKKPDLETLNRIASPKPLNDRTEEKIDFKKEIILDNLTYRYPNVSKNALNEISLKLPKGQSIALIGQSGAGKTTLVDVILGLLTPSQGDLKVDGNSIYKNLRSWQNLIGYIPQSIFLIDDTIEKNIAFGIRENEIDQQRLDKAIQAAQLSEVIDNLPDGLKTRVGERGVMLSGGQRQRVGIARALYHEREILVLDEATSALDNETEQLVTEAIKSLSGIKTMIIIAHRLTTVEHCDRIYMLEKGRVVKSGTYQEVVLKEQSIR